MGAFQLHVAKLYGWIIMRPRKRRPIQRIGEVVNYEDIIPPVQRI